MKLIEIKNQEGQSLVEFALVLPVLLLIVMGIVQFAFIFSYHIIAYNVSRDGARTAAVLSSADEEDIESIMKENMLELNFLNQPEENFTVNIVRDYDNGTVSSTVELPFEVNLPLMSAIIGDTWPIKAFTKMRIEGSISTSTY